MSQRYAVNVVRPLWIALLPTLLACGARTGLELEGESGRLGTTWEWDLGPFGGDSEGAECLFIEMPRDFDLMAIELQLLDGPEVDVELNIFRIDGPSVYRDGDRFHSDREDPLPEGRWPCTSRFPDPLTEHRLFTDGPAGMRVGERTTWELPTSAALPLPRGTLLSVSLVDFRSDGRGHRGPPFGHSRLRLIERPPPISDWVGFLYASNRAEYERQTGGDPDAQLGRVEMSARCPLPGPADVLIAWGRTNDGVTEISVVGEDGVAAEPFYSDFRPRFPHPGYYGRGEVSVPAGGSLEYFCDPRSYSESWPRDCAMELYYAPAARFAPDIACIAP